MRRRVMATVELTTENFDTVTGGDGLVLVDFWA
jgi:thioredoxin 1